MRKKPETAGVLLRRLAEDPKWLSEHEQEEREREARAAQWRVDEASLVEELRAAGYGVTSVWDFVNNTPHPVLKRNFIGPYEGAYPILIRHLEVEHLSRVREGIARALTVKDGGDMVANALLHAFASESDADLRWVLANALRKAMPYHRRRRHPEIARTLKEYADPEGAA